MSGAATDAWSASTRPWRLAVIVIAALSALGGLAGELILVLHLDDVFLSLGERVFWPTGHPPHPVSPDTRLGQAIGFGFWTGISVTQAWLAWTLHDEALAQVARALLAGHVVWWLLDSAGSAAAGAWLNVITNTGYFVALGVPLMRLSRDPAGTA